MYYSFFSNFHQEVLPFMSHFIPRFGFFKIDFYNFKNSGTLADTSNPIAASTGNQYRNALNPHSIMLENMVDLHFILIFIIFSLKFSATKLWSIQFYLFLDEFRELAGGSRDAADARWTASRLVQRMFDRNYEIFKHYSLKFI